MTDIGRRTFVRSTVVAGVGTSIMPSIISAESTDSKEINLLPFIIAPKKIIIAGAGIAGLCCGYELMKRGHEVTVLEASGRHGGHVLTGYDGLSDGLYADFGAEHITKPGYDRYWQYIDEFNLPVMAYPRRDNILRRIDGQFYTEEMLADPIILKKFGLNQREIKYLSQNPWWDLESLYVKPYLDDFTDEYQPFGAGFDHLDVQSMSELFQKDGASAGALKLLGGQHVSTLYELWRTAILHLRGVPLFPTKVFRLRGGNQGLTNTFAKRLGERVKLNCPITSISHGETGVTVTYTEFGESEEISADFMVNCIPLPIFQRIQLHPVLSPEKQFVVHNVTYGSYSRLVFQARSKFWLDDNLSINMQLNHPLINSVWQVAEEVDTHRVALMGVAPGGVEPWDAAKAFKDIYPGKHFTIEQAMIKDWTKERFAPMCERLDFPIGQLKKFWPHVMEPHGRIHFAGSYADNLNWGMEAATRSANRVAEAIHQA